MHVESFFLYYSKVHTSLYRKLYTISNIIISQIETYTPYSSNENVFALMPVIICSITYWIKINDLHFKIYS